MDQDAKSEALKIVRRYSLQVEKHLPNNEAARAVGELERRNVEVERRKERENLEWQQFLQFAKPEVDDDIAPFVKECQELAETWAEFKLRLPELEKGLPVIRGRPNISTVRIAVDQAAQQWERKKNKGFARARAGFYQFCGTLDAHSELFNFFPDGDKYISLFSGVISTIVKASARYERIAEGFARAMSELSTYLDQSLRQCNIYPTPKMKTYIMTMYIKYLKFLSSTMKWYQSKWERLKSSVNADYYRSEFEARIDEVKGLVDNIVREAGMETQKNISEMKIQFPEMKFQLQVMKEAIALLGQGTLVATGQRLIYDVALDEARQKALQTIIEPESYEDRPSDLKEPLSYSRVELEVDTTGLDRYIGGSKLYEPPLVQNTTKQVSGEIVIRLQSWLSSIKSQTLWIMGLPHNTSRCSEVTLVATHVSSLCRLNGIAYVSFFCQPSSKAISHIAQVIALLYSLIRQLTVYAPSSISKSSCLRSNVAQLDGTTASIPYAMSIISTLICIGPGLLLLTVDGLQYLDHTSSRVHVESLLDTLQRSGRAEQVLKLLLTTDGFFDGGKMVKVEDRLDCRVLPKKIGPGPLAGRKGLQSVSMSRPK